MVNKVVKDIKDAAYKFSVGRTNDARHLTRETSLKITQYFYNNTCFDLTTQDNFGVKSLHKKVATRTGDKFIRIIREYTTPYVNVHGFRDFVDSINKEDGPILNAIKAQFDGDQMYLTGGFAELCSDNIYDGHSFSIALMYPEEILNNHKSIFCAISGLVISKHNLDNIPVNPVHGKDVGFVHDVVPDFELIIKSYQVLCNKAEIGKEKFYFTLGATVQESCRVQLEDKEAGIYIYEQSKNITTGHTESILIKFLKFSEVSAEHGIFKNKLEASVSLNLEKTQREKVHELEQEKFMNDKIKLEIERENLELKRQVQQQEKELSKIKSEFELLKISQEKDLTTTKFIYEKKMIELSSIFEQVKHSFRVTENNMKLQTLLRENEYEEIAHTRKLVEIKNKQELDHQIFITGYIDTQLKRDNILMQREADNFNFCIKKKMLEFTNDLDIQQHERKLVDESNKSLNSGFSLVSTLLKLFK